MAASVSVFAATSEGFFDWIKHAPFRRGKIPKKFEIPIDSARGGL